MSHFDFDPASDGFGYPAAAGTGTASTGPYIPEARECMSCGVCVAGCPTYKVRREENFGPRGRVRLFERVLNRQEQLGDAEWAALDACTLCRACETVCPSKMDYADLYRRTVEAIGPRTKPPLAIRLLLDVVAQRRSAQRLASRLISLYQHSGLQRVLRSLPLATFGGSLKRMEQLLPVSHRSRPIPRYQAAAARPRRGRVALFTGCIANILDGPTHAATMKLLARLGYDVSVLADQTCCGAVYAHNGQTGRARACARRNIAAITASGADAVIHSASGCGAFFSEYPSLLSEDSDGTVPDGMPQPVDILDFLAATDTLDTLTFRPLQTRAAVHEPCSQRNVLKNQAALYDLLDRIPGLEVVALPGTEVCCGAGGTKMLTQPAFATPLRNDKVTAVAAVGAGLLISSNLSCALHLASGLRLQGHDTEVMHPVRLLADQLL